MEPQLTLYSYYRSSASYRVRIALQFKKLPFKYVSIDLTKNGGEQYSDKFKKLNPLSQVPCLVHNDHVLTQSVAIFQYLEDICPAPALFPRNPFDNALVMQICELINSGIQPLQNSSVLKQLEKDFKASEEDKKKWIGFWVHKGFHALETLLAKTAGPFCLGEKLTAADCFLVPQVFSAARFGVDLSDYPNIRKVNEHMLTIHEVRLALPEQQIDAQPAST